jgi:hypothetical protein
MYVYLEAKNGFNDTLTHITDAINYCKETNRVLLLNTKKSCYKFDFEEYFYFKDININIITDINIIKGIIADKSLSIYPNIFEDRNINNWNFIYIPEKREYLEEKSRTPMNLPYNNINENIIITVLTRGRYYTRTLFNKLYFNKNIIDHVNTRYAKLPKPYLCIQIRNTDYKCNYKLLYESNKDKIHSYNTIYIATDDKESIEWFKSKGLSPYNFTQYPNILNISLHQSNISPDRKIKDLICDIYIIAMADELLSNSKGGFINLCRDIRKNPKLLADKFLTT